MAEEEVATTAAPAEVTTDEMDLNTAYQEVLKKALACQGLVRGVRECVRALEKGEAQMCILAEDCNQEDYKRLIEALCAEKGVPIIKIGENKQLGEWSGLCKIDSSGNARKVVATSCAVITDTGEDSSTVLEKL